LGERYQFVFDAIGAANFGAMGDIDMQELEVELRERGYSKAADTNRPFQIQFIELQVVPCRALEKD
jgi:hypothetical protein